MGHEAQELKATAEKKMKKQKEALAAATESASTQSKAASKDTEEAQKKFEAAQKKAIFEEAAIVAAGAKATDEAKARLAATQKAAKDDGEAVDAEKQIQEAIVKARRTTVKKLKNEMDEADKTLQDKMEKIEKVKEESKANFAEEAKKIEQEDRKKTEEDNKVDKAKQQALKAEVEADKKKEQVEMDAILKADKKRADALDKVNKEAEKIANEKQEAENARRANVKVALEAEEAKSEKTYKEESAEAHKESIEADQAVKKSHVKSATAQEAMNKMVAADDAVDDAEAMCATDENGDATECEVCVENGEDDDKCHCEKMHKDKGPFMGIDGFSCSSTKPARDPYDGEGWAKLDSPLAKTELKAVDGHKCDELKTDATGILKKAFDSPKFPLQTVACDQDSTFKQKLGLINKIFERAAVCVPYCFPGTDTMTDDSIADSNGICISIEDMEALKYQIDNTVKSHDFDATGTNGRFTAGPEPDLCNIATEMMCGLAAGQGLPECASVDTSKDQPDEVNADSVVTERTSM